MNLRPWLWLLVPACLLTGCALLGPRHGELQSPGTVAVAPFAMGQPDAVLLVTGGGNGRLEICFCSGTAPGGLSRRASLIQSYRSAYSGAIAIDLGDAFHIDSQSVRDDFVLLGYRQIPYDVMVLGDQELAPSTGRLGKLLSFSGPPVLLSSSVAAASSQPAMPVQTSVQRTCGKLKVEILSYVSPYLMGLWPQRKAELSFTPLADLAARAKAIQAAGGTVVLAVHGDNDTVAEAAAACGADLILQGHTGRAEPTLRMVAGTPVAKIGSADIVGVLAMKQQGAKLALEYRLEPVDERWPVDARLLLTYQAYAHAALTDLGNRSMPLELTPSATCGKCHVREYQSWQNGPHAKAYDTLVKAGKAGDPACVICHTTGSGLAGGFVSMEKTPGLAGVNCQDCHRADLTDHRAVAFKSPGITAQTCDACHTPMTSPGFNFQIKKLGIHGNP